MENKKKTGLLLSALGVLSLVLITAGVTYAFFSYAKEGTTTNTVSTGTIEFAYNETDDGTQGILIENAIPMTDAQGMALSETGTGGSERNAFKFTVTSKTTSNTSINYAVTARKITGTIDEDQIKVYLTSSQTGTNAAVVGTNNTFTTSGEEPNVTTTVKTYDQLPTFSNATDGYPVGLTLTETEKVLYTATIPSGQTDTYTNSFVLRMWLNGEGTTNVDYSPYEWVLKSKVSGNTALNFDDLARGTEIIKSVPYYNLPATGSCSNDSGTTKATCTGTWTSGKDEYERIAYVKRSEEKLFTVSQEPASTEGYTATEQYYEINGGTFTVRVNVYAEGANAIVNPSAS